MSRFEDEEYEPGFEDEDPYSEGMKVELLSMVMTGKIKRKDYLKAIKE